jgi:transcriptional regulator with XRE-family HTH domain
MQDRFLALRRVSGLSQSDLASRAGVSRSLVAAIEAGRNTPSVTAGIALATALGVTAEELFAPETAVAVPATAAAAAAPLRDDDAVRLVRVGDAVVAARCDPLVDGTVADAVVVSGALRHLPGSREDGVLVLGCDPAMRLIERMAPPDVRIVTGHATSGDSITALSDRRCHAAVVHAIDGAPSRLPEAVAQTAIARWRVGIAANVPEDEIVDRLRSRQLALVCQSPTANAQVAVERWLHTHGLDDVRRAGLAGDHLEAARMAHAGGIASVTYEPASLREGLSLVAVETHRVDALVRLDITAAASAVAEIVTSRAFRARLQTLAGYLPA